MQGVRQLPDHIPGDSRAWKKKKRKEVDAVLAFLRRARLGSYFTPDRGELQEAEDALLRLRDKMKTRRWVGDDVRHFIGEDET